MENLYDQTWGMDNMRKISLILLALLTACCIYGCAFGGAGGLADAATAPVVQTVRQTEDTIYNTSTAAQTVRQTKSAVYNRPTAAQAAVLSNSRTVYVAPTGKRYHFRKTCAGKNAKATTLKQAMASGRDACKKCAQ